ncbi:hypothetical protein HDU96_006140 [Phlyctochytrium bullatum]|nr:hypothetical protein HDU96_006140 [Phlyctochytrium bullatum]
MADLASWVAAKAKGATAAFLNGANNQQAPSTTASSTSRVKTAPAPIITASGGLQSNHHSPSIIHASPVVALPAEGGISGSSSSRKSPTTNQPGGFYGIPMARSGVGSTTHSTPHHGPIRPSNASSSSGHSGNAPSLPQIDVFPNRTRAASTASSSDGSVHTVATTLTTSNAFGKVKRKVVGGIGAAGSGPISGAVDGNASRQRASPPKLQLAIAAFDDFEDLDEALPVTGLGQSGQAPFSSNRMAAAPAPTTPVRISGYFSSSPTTTNSLTRTPRNENYVKPPASEVARSGWLWHKKQKDWQKAYVILTTCQRSNTGLIQLYMSSEEIHPSLVIELQGVCDVYPNPIIPDIPDISSAALGSSPDGESSSQPVDPSCFTVKAGYLEATFAAASAADRSNWITALKMLITRSSATAESPSGLSAGIGLRNFTPPGNYTIAQEIVTNSASSPMSTAKEGTDASMLEMRGVLQKALEGFPASGNSFGTTHAETTPPRVPGSVLAAAGKSFQAANRAEDEPSTTPTTTNPLFADLVEAVTKIADERTLKVMDTIWSAHTTAQNSLAVTQLQRTEEIETAIADLTDSVEMRTSRIAKMVHELLQKEKGGEDGKGMVEAVKQAVMEVLGQSEVINALREEKEAAKKALGSQDSSVDDKEAAKDETDDSAASKVVTDEALAKLDSCVENTAQVRLRINRLSDFQTQLSDDIKSLTTLINNNISGDHPLLQDLTDLAALLRALNIPQLSKALEEIQQHLHATDASSSQLKTSFSESLETFSSKLESIVSSKLNDHAQVSAAIMGVLNDISGAKKEAEGHSRSTTVSSTSVAEDAVAAKLDNVLEVIDFVHKSQCRLVSLITDRLKAASQRSFTDEELSKLRELVSKTVAESWPKTSSTAPTGVPEELSTSLTELKTLSQEIRDAQDSLKRSLNGRPASDSSTGDGTSMVATVTPSHYLKEQLEDIYSKVATLGRTFASRQDLVEAWMSRNNDLLKLVAKGVQELERSERRLGVAGALAGPNAPGSPVKGGGMGVGDQAMAGKLDALAEKLDRLLRLSEDEEATPRPSRHGTHNNLAAEAIKPEPGVAEAVWDQLQARMSKHLDGLRAEEAEMRGRMSETAVRHQQLEREVGELEARKERLRGEVEELERRREEAAAVAEASKQLEKLEEDLQGRVKVLAAELKALARKKSVIGAWKGAETA